MFSVVPLMDVEKMLCIFSTLIPRDFGPLCIPIPGNSFWVPSFYPESQKQYMKDQNLFNFVLLMF